MPFAWRRSTAICRALLRSSGEAERYFDATPTSLPRVRSEPARSSMSDLREDPAYLSGDPLPVAGVEVAGICTILVIPMLKENEPVGVISIYRKEVRPFTNKQIELVT